MGLPPIPSGIGSIATRWAIGTVPSGEISNGFWIYSSALESFSPADLQTLLGDFILTPLNTLLSLVPANVSCSVCQLTTYGVTPLRITLPGPLAVGAGAVSTPITDALVLSWRSGLGGQRARSTTWLPLPRDDVDEDGRMLTTAAYGSAQGSAFAFLNQMNAMTVGAGQPVEMVTVHRRKASGPDTVTSFSPVVYGHPSRWVGHLDRRLKSRGRAPST